MIEDFWNAHPAFDILLDHPRTLEYISQIILGRYTINNSEIRIRYPGNASGTHMGGPIDDIDDRAVPGPQGTEP